MSDLFSVVDPESWDVFITDSEPVEYVNLKGLAQLVKGSPLGVDRAMQALQDKGMDGALAARVWLELAELS